MGAINYKILQLKDLENCKYAFLWWDKAKDKFDINDYEVVYSGKVPADKNTMQILDNLFTKFNIDHPDDFTGHSLSVSDVVDLDGEKYYCDSIGWVKI
jgi:hypothetical protein